MAGRFSSAPLTSRRSKVAVVPTGRIERRSRVSHWTFFFIILYCTFSLPCLCNFDWGCLSGLSLPTDWTPTEALCLHCTAAWTCPNPSHHILITCIFGLFSNNIKNTSNHFYKTKGFGRRYSDSTAEFGQMATAANSHTAYQCRRPRSSGKRCSTGRTQWSWQLAKENNGCSTGGTGGTGDDSNQHVEQQVPNHWRGC